MTQSLMLYRNSMKRKEGTEFCLSIASPITVFDTQIADLSLKVFISMRHLLEIQKISENSYLSDWNIDFWIEFEESQDVKILKTLIQLVERQKQRPYRNFTKAFSQYCDALSVYNSSLTQRRFNPNLNDQKKSQEEKEFFPWKMLSFFHHCLNVPEIDMSSGSNSGTTNSTFASKSSSTKETLKDNDLQQNHSSEAEGIDRAISQDFSLRKVQASTLPVIYLGTISPSASRESPERHQSYKKQESFDPEIISYIESKLETAIVTDLYLLSALYNVELTQEKITFLERKYYFSLFHAYYDCSKFAKKCSNIEEHVNIKMHELRTIWGSTTLSSDDKKDRCEKMWKDLTQNEPQIDEILKKPEIVDLDLEIKKQQNSLNEYLESAKKCYRNSKIKEIILAIEALYELVSLRITLCYAETLQKTASVSDQNSSTDPEVYQQFYVILGEALTIVLQDITLSISQIKSIKNLRSNIRDIRNYYEHPEDYFLLMDQPGDQKKAQQVKELEMDLFSHIGNLLSLLKIRVTKIEQLIASHGQKEIRDIITALSNRDSGSDNKNSHLEFFEEKFFGIKNFHKRIIDKRSYYKKLQEEKDKLQSLLFDPLLNIQKFPILGLMKSIHDLKSTISEKSRQELLTLLNQSVPFRLMVQRKLSTCYRWFEYSMNDIKKDPALVKVPLEFLERIFFDLKDLRNYQTHDLWRTNSNQTLNVIYLLAEDLFNHLFDNQFGNIEPPDETELELRRVNKEKTLKFMTQIKDENVDEVEFLNAVNDEEFDINVQDQFGCSLLHCLAHKNTALNLKLAKVLIEKEANIHLANFNLQRPLHIACRSSFYELVTLLVEKGAVVENSMKSGFPLLTEHTDEYHRMIEFLSQHASEGRQDQASNLMQAVLRTNVEEVRRSIDEGALPWIDFMGKIPLVQLFSHKEANPQAQLQIARILIANGAEINKKEPESGNTCLHYAAYYTDDQETIEYLLGLNPNIHIKNRELETPLNKAAAAKHRNWVKALLEKGANPETSDEMGTTPLLSASTLSPPFLRSQSHDPEIIKLLLKFGANPNSTNNYGSALHYAARGGTIFSVDYLLDAGALPFVKGKRFNHGRFLSGRYAHEVASNSQIQARILEKAIYILSHLSDADQELSQVRDWGEHVKKAFQQRSLKI